MHDPIAKTAFYSCRHPESSAFAVRTLQVLPVLHATKSRPLYGRHMPSQESKQFTNINEDKQRCHGEHCRQHHLTGSQLAVAAHGLRHRIA